MKPIIIGADIGGSHITCMAADSQNHSILEEINVRREVESQAEAGIILTAWADALAAMIRKIGAGNLGGIGFAMPGPFDYPGGRAWFRGVKKYDSLYGIDIRGELRQRLGLDPDLPVRFLNDATCFAIGEAWIGRGKSCQRNMAITLGTGFGSAFILDGIPVESGPEVPADGCVYHLPYGKSIANDYFSTSWFQERAYELTGANYPGVREIAEEVGLSITSGIRHQVSGIFDEFGTALGKFLAPWLIKFNAECLTVGGSISNSYHLFEKPFKAALRENGCGIPVFLSSLGELAAIAGAARLCDDAFYARLPFISGK
jgi:glucokinase